MKTPALESLFNKAAGPQAWKFTKKETLSQAHFCETCEIFKSTFLQNKSGGSFHETSHVNEKKKRFYNSSFFLVLY